ncbi:MAG: helix-turn-helix transcriptional regulator [Ruminococcaceae bacterium]|nr:helix-turn-helix transcriptional regulator [Oscillospiraceae bacterium]
MLTLGERLKFLRTIHNKTQAEIGEIIGVGQSVISNYENDITVPRTQNLVVLARYFGVRVAYLIGDSKSMYEKGKKYIISQKIPLVSHDTVLDLPKFIVTEASEYIQAPIIEEINADIFAVKIMWQGREAILVAQRGEKKSKLVLCDKEGSVQVLTREQAKKEKYRILASMLFVL